MKKFRVFLYQNLVNKHQGITYRYHRFHDGSFGVKKIVSWIYLIWLNFAYYCLFCRFIGKKREVEIYEENNILVKQSESKTYLLETGLNLKTFVDSLVDFDIISFDIFDTLIFRPVAVPVDVFRLCAQKLGIMDFANIRVCNERDARVKQYNKFKNMEINLSDIWENIENDVGISKDKGMLLEEQIEEGICYANPFMKEVWQELQNRGKRIIVTSDMYLGKQCIERILDKNGYIGYERLYLSNEFQCSKADGNLYKHLISDYPRETIVHIGDNPHSDHYMAKKAGLSIKEYQNINKYMLQYRPHDMSSMIGSAYRALVSSHIYNGLNAFSMEYEYGYIYGGLFVLGYCCFIYDYVKKNSVDKVIFLSRDGDIIKKVYNLLFPKEESDYVYWSRKAATKMEAFYDKHDYFRRFIYHKVNQNYTILEALKSMELEFLVEELVDWKEIWNHLEIKNEKDVFIDLKSTDELTDKNSLLLRRFIEAKWDKVISYYQPQMDSTRRYYSSVVRNCKKILAVDIGWAGSGAMALSHLIEEEWNMSCEVIGMIAGTNTIYNAEPDASEPFLQSGKLVSYLYSQSHNRDLLKKHDPNKDYNVFWELLLSSPTPQFKGFYAGDVVNNNSKDRYLEKLDITLQFGKYDFNQVGIKEIQKGILDFVGQYREHWGNPINGEFAYMYNISGRDAYAPMLLAASHNERYLKEIKKLFDFEINVN